MSQRYGAMLESVAAHGYRAGCEAYVFLGKRGVELELRLPRENSEIVFPVVAVPAQGRALESAGAASWARKNVLQKPAWIAAGVAGAVLLIAISGRIAFRQFWAGCEHHHFEQSGYLERCGCAAGHDDDNHHNCGATTAASGDERCCSATSDNQVE